MYAPTRHLLVLPVQLLYMPLCPRTRFHLSFIVWVGLTGPLAPGMVLLWSLHSENSTWNLQWRNAKRGTCLIPHSPWNCSAGRKSACTFIWIWMWSCLKLLIPEFSVIWPSGSQLGDSFVPHRSLSNVWRQFWVVVLGPTGIYCVKIRDDPKHPKMHVTACLLFLHNKESFGPKSQ